MKKPVKIILICVAAFLIVAAAVTVLVFEINNHKLYSIDYSAIEKNEDYSVVRVEGTKYPTVQKLDDSDFKILTFTDTHLDLDYGKGEATYEFMIRNINTFKPDLVVFVGDNVTSAYNRERAKQLGEFMEKCGVYWTFVLGNHEGDNIGSISRQKMCDIFASFDHCVADSSVKTTGDGTKVWGVGNHAVNILDKDGNITETLFLLDGGNEMTKQDIKKYGLENSKETDDYIKASQIKWYEETVKDIAGIAGHTVRSVVFDHIPLPEFKEAYNLITKDETEVIYESDAGTDNCLIEGLKLERVCCSGHNEGFFDKMLELGSTKLVVCGHDHLNSFLLKYSNIKLAYAQDSGYGSYNLVSKHKGDTLYEGCMVITINNEGRHSVKHYLNSELYPEYVIGLEELYK